MVKQRLLIFEKLTKTTKTALGKKYLFLVIYNLL